MNGGMNEHQTLQDDWNEDEFAGETIYLGVNPEDGERHKKIVDKLLQNDARYVHVKVYTGVIVVANCK